VASDRGGSRGEAALADAAIEPNYSTTSRWSMTDNGLRCEMAEFKKGLSQNFVNALHALADQRSWWLDVLKDTNLIIAVRNEYINVYWQGQSLFKIGYNAGRIIASTHPKYLLDPSLTQQASFDIDNQAFRIPPRALITFN
jgi:hypothetical protein